MKVEPRKKGDVQDGSSRQLRMNFEPDLRLLKLIQSGKFITLAELPPLSRKQPFKEAMATLGQTVEQMNKEETVAGFTLLDRCMSEEEYTPIEVGERLREMSEKPVMLTFSGKGTGQERLGTLLLDADTANFKTVLAVTGNASELHEVDRAEGSISPHPSGYLDSVDIIRAGCEKTVCMGATINPFKYTLADSQLQYCKLLRKVASGAEFIVSQAGWDMKKLQELQWFLRMREVDVPVIARLAILSAKKIRSLGSRVFPGMHISRELLRIFEVESRISESQALAAQSERLALQVIGCRLLGFNGVQICGLNDAGAVQAVFRSIRQRETEIQDYAGWLHAWFNFHGEIPFAPVNSPYYLFTNLLRKDSPCMYAPEKCPLDSKPVPPPLEKDQKLMLRLLPRIAFRQGTWVEKTIRFLLQREDCTSPERLPYCYYLDNSACPKRLVLGPCGGADPNGGCEFGTGSCFFHRVLSLAAERGDLEHLEKKID